MMLLNIFMLYFLYSFSARYHNVTTRITNANHIVSLVQTEIYKESFYLTSGRNDLETTKLPEILSIIRTTINDLDRSTVQENIHKILETASKVMNTLERYTSILMDQIANNEKVDDRKATLEEIDSVSGLLYDYLISYINSELDYYEQLNTEIQTRVQRLIIFNFIMLGVMILLLIRTLYNISNSIAVPIDNLIMNTRKLAEGDFGVYIENDTSNEITALTDSFNSMVKKLQIQMETIKENTRERERLELRLMQEQVNPHFIYNTLETIIWMAESGEKEKIIEIVKSLSKFFRIVLSEGRDIITIQEEISYIESYLFIQKMRYSDIMDYTIKIPEELLNYRIQKLSLQPLVENALYHGIKKKRSFGTIQITAVRNGKNILFSVYDDGCGISHEQLSLLKNIINQRINPSSGNFGLYNLQKRIQLCYGENYGIAIESQEGKGTEVILCIPAQT
ncbi:MAG: sensor histidine kinase [Clostridiaceae bacterium]|nr:sensor histidine kinase [Clostridiaceae bacterium]